MPILRFPGLAKSSNGTNGEALSKLTGYTLVRDGDDWIVPEDDPKILSGPSPIFFTEPKPIPLNPESFKYITDIYIDKYICKDLDSDIDTSDFETITVPSQYGITTDIYANKIEFFFNRIKNGELERYMTSTLLPFAYNELKAKYVSPLVVDVKYQQSIISLNKIILLVNKFGFEQGTQKIMEDRALESILPSPVSLFSYIEALLTFSPFAITLPYNRIGSQLHFFAEKNWLFDRIATCGIYEMMLFDPEPISKQDDINFIETYKLSSIAGRRYYWVVVNAINSLMKFINNPLSFVDNRGIIDHQQLVQTHGTVNLMLADVASINFTNSKHIKLRMSLSFIDKMANLICSLNKNGHFLSEADMFKKMLRRDYGDKLARLLKYNFGLYDESLGKLMMSATTNIYDTIFKKLSESLKTSDESELLVHLRTMRNTNHGTFLNKDQFEKTFYISSAYIPYEIIYLPSLLTLGFSLDADRFINI